MTTPLGHSLFGVAVYWITRMQRQPNLPLLAALVLAAWSPDIDYYPVLWGDWALANYNHQWFTHSIFFVALASVAIAIVARWFGAGAPVKTYPWIFAAGASHLLLDAFTVDTRHPIGLQLLWPFTDQRFRAPTYVFPSFNKKDISTMLHVDNLAVLAAELLIVGLPAYILWRLATHMQQQNISSRTGR